MLELPSPTPNAPGPLHVLAWLLGFGLIAVLGARWTPWPEDFSVKARMDYIAQHPDEIDALFIGSSNVFRSFVPEIIDEKLAQAGFPLRSYNLGGPSMFSFETDFVLRKVLAIDGLELDYVILEPGDWNGEPKSEPERANLLSNRSVFWHDLRQTWNLMRSFANDSGTPLGPRLSLGLAHLHAWSWKMTSYGQGRRIVLNLRGVPLEHDLTAEQIARGRGFQALDDAPGTVMEERRKLLTRDIDGYWSKLRKMRRDNRLPLAADSFCREAIAAQRELVRAAGAEALYAVAPSGAEMHHALRLAEQGDVTVFAFNDPDRYPQFYRVERRFDPNHLDREGAELFSATFAEQFAGYLRSRE